MALTDRSHRNHPTGGRNEAFLFRDRSPFWYVESNRERNARLAMRVSDAERNAVAEVLSQHFADGRLDTQEFDERLGSAMSAKTRGDFEPLLSDLPQLEMFSAPGKRRHLGSRILLILIATLIAVGIFSTMVQTHFFGLFFVVVAMALLSRRHRHHRHHAELR